MLLRFPACRLATRKAREDGPHQAPVRRGVVGDDVQFPPGVVTNFGYPQGASPFIQAKLPAPMKFEGKKSRCVSFVGDDKDGFRGAKGTTKTKHQAIQAAAAWCNCLMRRPSPGSRRVPTARRSARCRVMKQQLAQVVPALKRARKHECLSSFLDTRLRYLCQLFDSRKWINTYTFTS